MGFEMLTWIHVHIAHDTRAFLLNPSYELFIMQFRTGATFKLRCFAISFVGCNKWKYDVGFSHFKDYSLMQTLDSDHLTIFSVSLFYLFIIYIYKS